MNAVELLTESLKAVDDRTPREVCMDENAPVLIFRDEEGDCVQLMLEDAEGGYVDPALDYEQGTFQVPDRIWKKCRELPWEIVDYHGRRAVLYEEV